MARPRTRLPQRRGRRQTAGPPRRPPARSVRSRSRRVPGFPAPGAARRPPRQATTGRSVSGWPRRSSRRPDTAGADVPPCPAEAPTERRRARTTSVSVRRNSRRVTGSPTNRPRATPIVGAPSKGTGADGASLGMIGRRRRSDGSSASGRSESASRSTAACTAGGTTVAAGEAATVFSPRLIGPVSGAREDRGAGPLHAHRDLVELPVVRMRRLVGDQVVGARVADHLAERRR